MQDRDEVSIHCPSCGFRNIRAFWSMKRNAEVQCGSCFATIPLEGTSLGYRIREVEAARQRLSDVLGKREPPSGDYPRPSAATSSSFRASDDQITSLEHMEKMLRDWDRDSQSENPVGEEEGSPEIRTLKDSA